MVPFSGPEWYESCDGIGGVGTGGADENDGKAGVACDRKVAGPQGPATPALT